MHLVPAARSSCRGGSSARASRRRARAAAPVCSRLSSAGEVGLISMQSVADLAKLVAHVPVISGRGGAHQHAIRRGRAEQPRYALAPAERFMEGSWKVHGRFTEGSRKPRYALTLAERRRRAVGQMHAHREVVGDGGRSRYGLTPAERRRRAVGLDVDACT